MKIFINPGHGGNGKFNAWYDTRNLRKQITWQVIQQHWNQGLAAQSVLRR